MIRIAISEPYPIPLPPEHRFPFRKYELVRQQLEYEGAVRSGQFFVPTFIDDAVITRTHDAAWWARVKAMALDDREYRQIGFPKCQELLDRSLCSTSGTVHAALHALEDGAGMNLAGGTHHAFFDRGEGFCLLNDIAVAANHLLHLGLVRRILVVDLDVHQGNGTASLFRDRPEVFTFSMHCKDNYPFRKETSDLDVELPVGMNGTDYLAELQRHLPHLYDALLPDLVFYLGGVDVLDTDRLGKLKVSRADCRRRDEWVISHAAARRIPLVLVMGGGYSEHYRDLVAAHCATYQLVLDYYEKKRIFHP